MLRQKKYTGSQVVRRLGAFLFCRLIAYLSFVAPIAPTWIVSRPHPEPKKPCQVTRFSAVPVVFLILFAGVKPLHQPRQFRSQKIGKSRRLLFVDD